MQVTSVLAVFFSGITLVFLVYDRIFNSGRRSQAVADKLAMHEAVCAERYRRIEEAVSRVETTVSDDAEAAEKFRHSTNNVLTTLQTNIAVNDEARRLLKTLRSQTSRRQRR